MRIQFQLRKEKDSRKTLYESIRGTSRVLQRVVAAIISFLPTNNLCVKSIFTRSVLATTSIRYKVIDNNNIFFTFVKLVIKNKLIKYSKCVFSKFEKVRFIFRFCFFLGEMMDMSQSHTFWEENAHVKYEGSNSNDEHPRFKDERSLFPCCDGNFNFATAPCSEDESEYGNGLYKKNKVSRQDPMSHRIIEKRRRDRMNNCLADLSRLIPTEYLKKGRGRIEKTEIIEMAIKYMKHLQHLHVSSNEHYRLGYQECMSEAMRFLVEVEGHFPREAICIRLLTHLQKHCDTLSRTSQTSSLSENNNIEHVEKVEEEKKIHDQIDLTKSDIEQNDSPCGPKSSESDEKHSDCSASYKYKNDIKLRFSQDLNSAAKKLKIDPTNIRRASVTSIENQSSNYSSPPSSNGELPTRIYSESDIPNNVRNYNLKSETRTTAPITRSHIINGNQYHPDKYKIEIKNFNIPIFVFHAKGSFYVPLTVDYFTLLPFLNNYNLMETFPNVQDIVLHPVSINVSFHSNCTTVKYKSQFSPTWH